MAGAPLRNLCQRRDSWATPPRVRERLAERHKRHPVSDHEAGVIDPIRRRGGRSDVGRDLRGIAVRPGEENPSSDGANKTNAIKRSLAHPRTKVDDAIEV